MNYKGKDIETNKWVYGDLLHLTNSPDCVIVTEAEYNYGDLLVLSFEVYPDSVGISTDYYDKDGKMIYEGDIVKTPKGYGKIIKVMGCWYISHLNRLLFSFERNDIKIMGNIFDFKNRKENKKWEKYFL